MAFSISMSEEKNYETEALAAHYRIVARAQRMRDQLKNNDDIRLSAKDLKTISVL